MHTGIYLPSCLCVHKQQFLGISHFLSVVNVADHKYIMTHNSHNHIFDDTAELGKFCGSFISDLAGKAIKERGIFTLGMITYKRL